jgi:hypothetical protein
MSGCFVGKVLKNAGLNPGNFKKCTIASGGRGKKSDAFGIICEMKTIFFEKQGRIGTFFF